MAGEAPKSSGKRLRPGQRLKEPGEFDRVYASRMALYGKMLVLKFRPNDTLKTRLGVSVSKKHGGAVVRNRIKRVFRESFRLLQDTLPPGYDLVLIPKPGPRTYAVRDVLAEMAELARKIPAKAGKNSSQSITPDSLGK